jgi:hypothetical protein
MAQRNRFGANGTPETWYALRPDGRIMGSKILCAGLSKEEKNAVEAEVKPVIASRPLEEAWTISLVKTGARLAVSVDGPDERLRSKNFVAETAELRQKLSDLLTNCGFPVVLSATPPVKPSGVKPAPAPPSVPRPVATPAKPSAPAKAQVAARPAASAIPPITPAPQRRVAAPLTPPASRVVPVDSHPDEEYDWESPHAAGERREIHQCAKCKRRFAVVYDSLPNEPRHTVSVACPHCWEVDRVDIGENAALARQYRADRLND